MRLYGLLLYLYPRSFRAEYGDEMAAIFRDRYRAAHGAARLALWFVALEEVVMNAPAMHWDLLKQDLRYTFRTLNRSRGFALTAVLVTALGLGANTAAFSVADFVLFRPLPFPEPESLVRICEGPVTGAGWGCNNQMSPANYRDFKSMSASFESLGAFANGAVNLVGRGEPRRLEMTQVTPEVLRLLGVRPLLGRTFQADGEVDRGAAIISYGLWQSQFGRGDVLGETVHLDGAAYTIIGVMPQAFYFPTRTVEMWTSLTLRADDFTDRSNNYLEAVGRLGPGVAFERAKEELDVLAERLRREYPDTNAETGVSFFRIRDTMSPRFRIMLLSLSGASLCLLLLTCANLANLLLARAAAQRDEFAIRAALGAGRERLVRQLVTQSVVLVMSGAALGVLVAAWTVPLFSSLVPPTLPVAAQPSLDVRVMAVGALFTALVAVGFGLFPALRTGRADFTALREGHRTGGGRRQRIRAVLITLEVTMSVVLLITAGLLIRAVWRVHAISPGFVSENVLTLKTALPRPKYESALRRSDFYDRVLSGVRALPGVEDAAFISGLPFVMTGIITGVEVPGNPAQGRRPEPVSHRWVTPQYFRTMGIPLHRGRDLADSDTRDRAWVAVVSESFAEHYWPNQDPIGRTFVHREQTRTIVGVVGDVKVRGVERTNEPQIYLPAQQVVDGWPVNFEPKDLVVRHSTQSLGLVPAIRQIVHGADPDQPVSNVRTMNDVVAGETAARRAQLQVLGTLAAVALLLSGVGIYGLLAFTVSQRSPEIAIRLALGAAPGRVGRMIFSEGVRLAALGLVLGVPTAYAAARAMDALLFGIAPSDPATFIGAIGLVFAIAVAGSVVPALRAVSVRPSSALRTEL